MIIYKTTNIINKKIYIGQTTKQTYNYLGSGLILLKAIKKYGVENFIREIIEICDTKEQTNIREKFWIKEFNSTDKNIGYNISIGGNGGNLGDLVNKKISESSKKNGRMIGNQLKKGIAPPNKGKQMSLEQKEKLRKPKTDIHKKNLSIVKMGKGTKKIKCLNNNIIYNSIKEACLELNLNNSNVVEILKGRLKSIKGFKFEYYLNS